ncbi:MAG TPA: hypothetical protein VG247_02825 [Pseudonocardiaceae bacterium]|jgi:hypothetical protein|nr:hypothetical protein [Pseudonocardiaceae bacterium]
MKLSSKVGIAMSVLTLATGIAASSAAAAPQQHAAKPNVATPSTDTNIIGEYGWNSNGSTGELYISSQANGAVKAILYDGGKTENLVGSWYQASGTLGLSRPMPDGTWQYYLYTLGGGPLAGNVKPQMFGGYYTINTNTSPYGSYLDNGITFPIK